MPRYGNNTIKAEAARSRIPAPGLVIQSLTSVSLGIQHGLTATMCEDSLCLPRMKLYVIDDSASGFVRGSESFATLDLIGAHGGRIRQLDVVSRLSFQTH